MKKIRLMLQGIRTLALCMYAAMALAPAHAQVYQNDYTTTHVDPYDRKWVSNDAIYRDDAQGIYYVAQTIWMQGSQWKWIGLTQCDKDMNVISTWEYHTDYDMEIRITDMDELKATEDIIITGFYIYEGNMSAPFTLSVKKYTGAVNWFHLFPDIEYLNAVSTKDDYIILAGRRQLPAAQRIHPITQTQGVLMRLDMNGNLVWEQDFEDDKYMSSGYGVSGLFNAFFDVTPIDGDNFAAVGITNNFIDGNFNDHWDADCFMVVFDGGGGIINSAALGNALPMDPSGQQSIQYERGQGITWDPLDNTVVITGERFEASQNHISSVCPHPDIWGLWATKMDPYGLGTNWSWLYDFGGLIGGPYMYGLLDNEIDHDNTGQYGITYNYIDAAHIMGQNKHYPMITKLDYDGRILYHRHHYLPDNIPTNDFVEFRDVTRSLEYNNIMAVGQHIPDPWSYYSSLGWNVEAYDNIQMDCQMVDWPMQEHEKPYDIIQVENQFTWNNIIDEPLHLKDIPLVNKIHCEKIQVAMKPGAAAGNAASTVLQNESTRELTVKIKNTGMLQAETATPAMYKAILYNATGQVLLRTDNFTGEIKMNASALAAGIYYLRVEGKDLRQTHTIAIQ